MTEDPAYVKHNVGRVSMPNFVQYVAPFRRR